MEAPGALPQIDEVETGQFLWEEKSVAMQAGLDVSPVLQALCPASGRRDCLMRLRVSGWASLSQRAALERGARNLAPDFAHFELLTEGLRALLDDVDIDAIDHAGALRQAAETLRDEAEDSALSETDRATAAEALARLYSYVTEHGP